MKNQIKKAIYLLSLTLMIVACKKDNPMRDQEAISSSQEWQQNTISTASLSSSFSVTVDVNGYLVFPSSDDVRKYIIYLSTNTLADIQEYHDSIGFISLAGPNFNGVSETSMLPEALIGNFTLSSKSMVRIKNTLYRPASNKQFMLAINVSNLNTVTYNKITNSIFDINTMNKFAAGGALAHSNENLIDFNDVTVSGYEEITPSETMGRPFIGTRTTYGPCNPPLGKIQYTHTYIFWIEVGVHIEDDYAPC